ncbi:hypothetical protein D3C81_1221970 [compost metagenome]
MQACCRALGVVAKGVIAGQLEHRLLAGQACAPVGQLALALAVIQPATLPGSEVGVLQCQCGQGLALIERAQLADHHLHRPGVGDDVVLHQHQHVVVGRQARQAYAQQRASGQVEGLAELACNEGLALAFFKWLALQVQRPGGEDVLARPFAFEGEAGAQRFMAGNQLVECSAQGGDIQRAAQAQHAGNVIGTALWGQLPQQPLALLGVRQRQLVARGLHRQGQRRSLLQLRQGLAEVAQARLVEQ